MFAHGIQARWRSIAFIRRGAVSCSRSGAIALLLLSAAKPATSSTIYSSTFQNASNTGTVGGGLFSGSANDATIGLGPWLGTYHGIAGLLAAPQLAISTTGGTVGGSAAISGIVGLNLLGLGLTDNYGWFYTNTGLAYQPNKTYTLSADVTVGSLLADLSLLSSSGIGIGLTSGNDTPLAFSTDSGSTLSLQLLPSTTVYHVTLQFTTGSSVPSGNIGIRLYEQPAGLLSADLFSGATFSNVQLDATDPTPEPATFALAGTALVVVGAWRWRKRE